MTRRLSPTPAIAPVRWVIIFLHFACAASLTLGLGACNAVRHAPGEVEYARSAVVDWVGDVVGAKPPDY